MPVPARPATLPAQAADLHPGPAGDPAEVLHAPDLAGLAELAELPELVVETREVETPPAALVRHLPAGTPATDLMTWVRRGEGAVAWGRAAELRTSGPGRFEQAQAWWRDLCERAVDPHGIDGLRGTGLVCFASMAFSDDSPVGSTLIVPRVVLGKQGGRAWLTTIRRAGEPPVLTGVPTPSAPPARPTGVRVEEGATSARAWPDVVAAGVTAIVAGEAEKVVLARDVVASADDPMDVRWLLSRLAAGYPDTWAFAVDGLVGATPEMLVRLDRGHVFSRVLAGTAPRENDIEDDQRAADALAGSAKDLSEHRYAVESVIERLSPLCESVLAPRQPSVLVLPNVFHLASDLNGRAAEGTTALGLAGALHPSAAVGGTPRAAAVRLIAELEGRDRGRYAGPVGWMDASGDGEFGIALRCGRIEPEDARSIRLYAGGGVVADSDPQAELLETEAKLAPMRAALGDD